MNALATPNGSADDPVAVLRSRVIAHLEAQGYALRNGRLITPVIADKARLREMHADAVAELRRKALPALGQFEDRFLRQLVAPEAVDIESVRPTLELVEDKSSFESKLWRWTALHWSIPVSAGYGRRLRFLVRDMGHGGALIGIIGLGDPVYSLSARDSWIGWTPEQRKEHLPQVMDAYALGAVPPYSSLLGGKLVALLATSDEVQKAFASKYSDRRTLIRDRVVSARLDLITTASALGRSSIYNRLLKPDGASAFERVGYTSGTGDFHFSGAIYDELVEFARLQSDGRTSRHETWGVGFRNRREVIQRALYALGFDGYAMRAHGVRRELFVAPLAPDTRAALQGTVRPDDRVIRAPWTTDEVVEWWRTRWAAKRASRDAAWRQFDSEEWRVWH